MPTPEESERTLARLRVMLMKMNGYPYTNIFKSCWAKAI
jgi:hypothetical protein